MTKDNKTELKSMEDFMRSEGVFCVQGGVDALTADRFEKETVVYSAGVDNTTVISEKRTWGIPNKGSFSVSASEKVNIPRVPERRTDVTSSMSRSFTHSA